MIKINMPKVCKTVCKRTLPYITLNTPEINPFLPYYVFTTRFDFSHIYLPQYWSNQLTSNWGNDSIYNGNGNPVCTLHHVSCTIFDEVPVPLSKGLVGLLVGWVKKIHKQACSGLINMILSAKRIYYFLPIHFACSIMQIGPLVAKLWCWFDCRWC